MNGAPDGGDVSPDARRGSARLEIVPSLLREANAFVCAHHRHHGPVRGCLFTLAVASGSEVVGVAIVGRPVSRVLQADGFTAEVLRVCVTSAHNACSMLYGGAWRAARALGYRRLVTYTLPEEGGGALRASGWRLVGESGGGSWSRCDRPRVDTHPLQRKLRWEVV